jgi:hypothetical protein
MRILATACVSVVLALIVSQPMGELHAGDEKADKDGYVR